MSTDLSKTCPKCGMEPRYIYARPPAPGEAERPVVVHADCGGVLGLVAPDQCPHCGGPALTLQPQRSPWLTLEEDAALQRGMVPAPTAEFRPCYCEGARAAARAKMPTLKDLIAAMPSEERAELVAELNRGSGIPTAAEAAKPSVLQDVVFKPAGPGPHRVELKTPMPPLLTNQQDLDALKAEGLATDNGDGTWSVVGVGPRVEVPDLRELEPDWTAATISRFRAYRAEHPSWGSLHLALDDGNLDDASVAFCVDYAAENGDVEGRTLALILRGMNEGQREYLRQALSEPEKH